MAPTAAAPAGPPGFDAARVGDDLVIRLSGDWRRGPVAAAAARLAGALDASPTPSRLSWDASALTHWDATAVALARSLRRAAADRRITTDDAGLPEGIRGFLALAQSGPDPRRDPERPFLAESAGRWALGSLRRTIEVFDFTGETVLASFRLLAGRSRLRPRDVLEQVVACGPRALGIVAIISGLTGVILGYLFSVQAANVGAEVYVPAGVGLAMVREMGPIMAAVVLAGRTGAAFAAQIGTMVVNEEVDALRALGLGPVDFLVLPRLLALSAMMPLLGIYATACGILGGLLISIGLSDLPLSLALKQTVLFLDLRAVAGALLKCVAFGALVAFAGCERGLACERSAAGVGRATTSAVVLGILLIVVADAVFAVIYNVFGI